MGKVWMPGGGGGADLDIITATAADIVAAKVGVNTDGEPVTGTVVDRGDWNASELAAGASVTIPAGKHGGNGRVTAKSLASQTQGTAIAETIQNGKTATVNGKLITGTMPERAASIITPSTTNQIISAGQRLAGDQTILGDPNLIPGNIALNKTVFGVRGTHSKIEEDPAYLYNAGTFASGLSMSSSGGMSEVVYGPPGIGCYSAIVRFNTAIDLTSYNYIKMVYTAQAIKVCNVVIGVKDDLSFAGSYIASSINTSYVYDPTRCTLVLNIASIIGPKWLFFDSGDGKSSSGGSVAGSSTIFQIYLSVA